MARLDAKELPLGSSLLFLLAIACGPGTPPQQRMAPRFITTKTLIAVDDDSGGGGGGGGTTTVTTQMLNPATGETVLELSADSTGAATWTSSGTIGSLTLGVDATAGDIESAAELIYGQVHKADQGANFDAFGCDVPRPFTPLTCGAQGACCDTHDLCYSQHGCTASSWFDKPGSTPCSVCNLQAVKCIMFTSPGPSDCCDGRNAWGGELCGTPRCPGLWGYGDYPYCGGYGPGGIPGGGTGSSGTGQAGGSGGSTCDDWGLWTDDECAADDECDGNSPVQLYDGTECWE